MTVTSENTSPIPHGQRPVLKSPVRPSGVTPESRSRSQTGRYRTLLAGHVIASMLIQSVWFGTSAMMPVLARKRFEAGDWQTLLITAAVSVCMVLSVFWNALLQRVTIRRYLGIHWMCTMGPLALAALAENFWALWAGYALAACGIAGWTPAAGEILKRLYPDHSRGRVFGVISAAVFLGMSGSTYLIGKGLEWDENFFRTYLPLACALYGAGVLLLCILLTVARVDRPGPVRKNAHHKGFMEEWLNPLVHMRQVLKADRVFYRYEAAFMTYGVGWMIGNALLPVLATDRLGMTYEEFAAVTQVPYTLCLLLCTYPMGWVNDRLGPARMSSLSFAALAIYPIGLILSNTINGVAFSTVWFGLAMAGVQIGWMIGPVTLAPSPDKVAQYSAIHATLVGLRGIVAQGLGMLIYRLTGSFFWPLAVAAFAYLWASRQMWALHVQLPSPRTLPTTSAVHPGGVGPANSHLPALEADTITKAGSSG